MAFSANAQNISIEFVHGTWDEIIAKAKKENKPIFLDAYASWCGPCKLMAAYVFTEDNVAEFFNAKFINAKIDMEKGEGINLSEKYEINAYPTFLILSPDGEVLHRACGAMDPEKFISWGKESFDKESRLGTLQQRYLNGERSLSFILKYIDALQKACLNSEKVAEEYLGSLKEDELFKRDNWKIFNSHIKDIDSKVFKTVINKYQKFYDLYGDEVDEKIVEAYQKKIKLSIQKEDEESYRKYMQNLKSLNFPKFKKAYVELEIEYYLSKEDWTNFASKAIEYVNNFNINNPDLLNNLAWIFYKKINDKKMLEKALEWSKKSIDLEYSYSNLDTYAALLYKLGNKKEAEKYAKLAIKKAEEENEDASETKELLKKIKSAK
jgi:thiol-disulfide isomerase/thioredoxin